MTRQKIRPATWLRLTAAAVALAATTATGTGAFAQGGAAAPPWERQHGTARDDVPQRVRVDAAGNAYLAGTTDADLGEPFAFGAEPMHAPAGDAWLVKYDRAGNEAWAARFGGPGYDVASDLGLDGAGNVYVAGSVAGALPGQSGLGATDAFLRKYDPAGQELWTRQFGTPGVDSTRALAVDGQGRAYVALAVGGSGFEVRAFGPDGASLWNRPFGPASHEPRAAAVDPAGAIYVAGIDHNEGRGEALVRAYGPDGGERWTYRSGTAASDGALGVTADADGAVYLVGSAVGALPGQTAPGRVDAFLRKLGPDGVERWVRQFGTERDDAARGVALAPGGHVLVAGMTDGSFERGAAPTADAFVRAFTADGRDAWVGRFGSPAYDVAHDVAADGSAAVVVGPTRGALAASGTGGADAFVRRVRPGDAPAASTQLPRTGGPAPVLAAVIGAGLAAAAWLLRRRGVTG
jgi:hypothetical protein